MLTWGRKLSLWSDIGTVTAETPEGPWSLTCLGRWEHLTCANLSNQNGSALRQRTSEGYQEGEQSEPKKISLLVLGPLQHGGSHGASLGRPRCRKPSRGMQNWNWPMKDKRGMKCSVAVSIAPAQGLRQTCLIFLVSLVLTSMFHFSGGRPARVETKWLRINGLWLVFL